MIDLNALSLPQLYEELTSDGSVDRLIYAAMVEDFGRGGDITTDSIVDPALSSKATLAARAGGVLAGMPVASRILLEQGGLRIEPLAQDGAPIHAGQELAHMVGARRRMLSVERVVLNLLGRLSGIATLTRQYVQAVAGTSAVICDTRKTTPGLRSLEKYAVRCGGGTLHRIGLFDAVLYKDNHLAGIPMDQLADRLRAAIRAARSRGELRFVEVEVDSLEQFERVLTLETGFVDMVLLDNMKPKALEQAVSLRDQAAPHVQLEASGGIGLQNVREIAQTGVDRISIGAITHAATWLDIGLDIR